MNNMAVEVFRQALVNVSILGMAALVAIVLVLGCSLIAYLVSEDVSAGMQEQ